MHNIIYFKKIRISLINQEIFDGTLKQLGMYDILLSLSIREKIMISGKEMIRDSNKDRIFMKSANSVMAFQNY